MDDLPLTRPELVAKIDAGEAFGFFFFWGHTPPADGSVNKSCLSQWFPVSFCVDGVTYKTAEHWMMAEKARLFDDAEMLEQIIASETPNEAKVCGRKVRNFDADVWGTQCFEIVVTGNVHKFSQNPAMQEFLLATGQTIIVEAAPRDQIWGIGLGEKNERATKPAEWRGRNLLGFALIEVRNRLS
jgi:ribA/ribD-fused uncharacterized protein